MEVVETAEGQAGLDVIRLRPLLGAWRVCLLAFSCLTIFLAVNQALNLNFFVGVVLFENNYLYALLGLMMSLVFVIFPATSSSVRDRVPWYDILLFAATLGIVCFFALNGKKIIELGWETGAPDHAVYLSYALWLLVLEAARRAGGNVLLGVILVVSLYPLYADRVPDFMSGIPFSLADTAAWHAMSNESILGIPMRAVGNIVIGFIIFGVALQHTGGGRFFIHLAFALLGHVRGGPAKVAIFASGLMGSMSGSVITNVLTTGAMTIPAMKRTGFSAPYAGGVEACASTGGVLMPPVMGATAFVMAQLLQIPYSEIVVAAAVPSILYFFGLFVQIDAHAARQNMPGMAREDLPRLGAVLKEGWYYIFAFALLVFMLLVLKREVLAPYYATPVLILLNQLSSRERWGWKELVHFIDATGRLFAELIAILAGVGLIIGALVVTGIPSGLVNELLHVAGGSVFALLLMGAATSFLLGIGMTVTAAYVFLAVLLAPALIQGGLNTMAVHLFILYWGMLSFITPPVALGAFAAATVAGANPMRTGFEAMRLGSIIYFIPFFFVLDQAFILKGTWDMILLLLASAAVGIVLISGGLQGYLLGVGNLATGSPWQWPVRGLVVVAGLLLALPGGTLVPLTNLELAVAAAVALAPAVVLSLWMRQTKTA